MNSVNSLAQLSVHVKKLFGLLFMNVCFLCEQSELKTILDLGLSPVANNLEREQSISIKSKKEPLILSQCSGDCGHVQIRDHINQELIFQDYLYTSSVSSTLSKHLSKIATELYIIQECDTIFPGKLKGYYNSSKISEKYFKKVLHSQNKIFGSQHVILGNKGSFLSLKKGDSFQ